MKISASTAGLRYSVCELSLLLNCYVRGSSQAYCEVFPESIHAMNFYCLVHPKLPPLYRISCLTSYQNLIPDTQTSYLVPKPHAPYLLPKLHTQISYLIRTLYPSLIPHTQIFLSVKVKNGRFTRQGACVHSGSSCFHSHIKKSPDTRPCICTCNCFNPIS